MTPQIMIKDCKPTFLHFKIIMIVMMMKDCKPATLPDLPFAFVTNLQYNVGSKYQIIVVIVIVIILPHIIMSLYKYIPSSPEADTLCEPVPSMAPVQSIRTQGDQHNHMHRRQGTTYQDLMLGQKATKIKTFDQLPN